MAPPKNISETRVRAALKRHNGMLALAAKELGFTRQNMHARLAKNPDLRQFLDDMAEQTVDLAENLVVKSIKKGDKPMTRWFLERKGRHRGYGTHIDGPAPAPSVDTGRRATIVNVLIRSLDAKAAAVQVQVQDGDRQLPALNGAVKPNGKGNGHG